MFVEEKLGSASYQSLLFPLNTYITLGLLWRGAYVSFELFQDDFSYSYLNIIQWDHLSLPPHMNLLAPPYQPCMQREVQALG